MPTVGNLLNVVGGIAKAIATDGLFDANGKGVTPVSAVAVTKTASDVVTAFEAEGIAFPPKVSEVITALPLLLSLVGIK